MPAAVSSPSIVQRSTATAAVLYGLTVSCCHHFITDAVFCACIRERSLRKLRFI